MSKKKLTPEQIQAIKGDDADLDGNLNDAVGLEPEMTSRTYFTGNLVQLYDDPAVNKNGLYHVSYETDDDGNRTPKFNFYGNILIHNMTVTYDKLDLFPELVSLEYTNTAIGQTSQLKRKPFSVIAKEISKKLLIDTNSLGIESVLRKIFIHSCNIDFPSGVSVNAETDLLKDGFFYDESTGKVISNNVFSNLETSDDDIREAIKLFNDLIHNRGSAIPNDCTLFRFMLWCPFSYCLKQIGFIDDLYSMVLWGVTDTNKTGSAVMFSNLYADRDVTLQKANTQSAMGTRLGENTFPLILDENKDTLADPNNEEFLKNIVTDEIGRSVKDRADNNLMNDFPALRMTVSTLNQDISYKPEFLKRYKVLYYDTSMQVKETAKREFNMKYKPKSPLTPLKQLRHLGKAFADRFIPYIESQSNELYDLEKLTIKILKDIADTYGVDFNMNVYLKHKQTIENTDKASVIRTGLNRLFARVHKKQHGQYGYMGADFQWCAKNSEISWLHYRPTQEDYLIKVSEFEQEISDIAGEHIPVIDVFKLLEIPTLEKIDGQVKSVKDKRKFKSSNVQTVTISEYNLTYKLFDITIYDSDGLEEAELEDKENREITGELLETDG